MDSIIIKFSDIVYRILRVCLHYISAIAHGFRGKKVPPVRDPILLLSATELARRIREGRLSSASVVQAYIDRIYEVDPYINATVDRRFTDALEEAKEADDLVASRKMTTDELEKEKPFLGVPFTVKLMIAVKGLRCTAGSLLFKHLRGQEDGASVALMKKAGAILLANTNTPECGMNLESKNKIHGTTVNPYDTSRTSGGSTGGESALIGAAGSIIGLGNDMTGSIRIPCCFTGIYCHKPSRGLVSNEGCFPTPDPELHYLLSTGPLCRYAEDLVTAMRILSSPQKISSKFGNEVHFKTLKVYYVLSFGENVPFVENVDPEIKDAVRRVTSHFQKNGSRIEEVSIPLFQYSLPISMYAVLSRIPNVAKTLTVGSVELNPLKELINFFCFRSIFTLSYIAVINAKSILYYPNRVNFYKELESKLGDQLNTLLDDNSILIVPTMPFPAPYCNEIEILIPSSAYSAIFSVFGLPATQCPVGMSKQGLPLGLQVVGQRGNDHLTIACALEIEKAFGGWKTP